MSEMTSPDGFAEFSAADHYFHQGEIRGVQGLLLDHGSAKLGRLDDEFVVTLNSITDLDRLKRMINAVFDANDWQELFSMPDCDAAIVITQSTAST